MTLAAAALAVPQPAEMFIASLTVAQLTTWFRLGLTKDTFAMQRPSCDTDGRSRTKHCRTPRRPRIRETRRRFVGHSASGFHQPLSSAQDDRSKVNDSSTTAQVDEFQRRRQLQPDKSGVTEDWDTTSSRSDLERNNFVTSVMDPHEPSESQVRDCAIVRGNPRPLSASGTSKR
jgi:hypothetical protein